MFSWISLFLFSQGPSSFPYVVPVQDYTLKDLTRWASCPSACYDMGNIQPYYFFHNAGPRAAAAHTQYSFSNHLSGSLVTRHLIEVAPVVQTEQWDLQPGVSGKH